MVQSKCLFHVKNAKALQSIGFYCDTGAGESRETGESVKGIAESTQGLITEAAAQQQDPEPQVRNETDEDESVDSFDYFARLQSHAIHAYFSYHPQKTTKN